MYCQYCGHEIHERASICMNCGCATGNRPVPATPAETEGTAPAVYATDESTKNGVVALILLLVLGQFGAHRFYLNRFGSATLMALIFIFFWVLIVLSGALETLEPEVSGLSDKLAGYSLMMLAGWFVWWIVDMILLCTGKMKDGLGRYVKL